MTCVLGQRVGALGEQGRHLGRAFEIELAVGALVRAQLGEGQVVARGGEHVVQAVIVRRDIMNVVGRDDISAHRRGHGQQPRDQPVVVGQPVAL